MPLKRSQHEQFRYPGDKMNSSTMHIVAVVALFGKAAVGGAGAALAVLGALNAAIAAIAHAWPLTNNVMLAVVISCGALLNGVVAVRHRKAG